MEGSKQKCKVTFNPGLVAKKLQELLDKWTPLHSFTMELREYLRGVYFEMEEKVEQADSDLFDIRVMRLVMDAMVYSPHFGSRTNIICFRDIMLRLEKNDISDLQEVVNIGNDIRKAGLNLAPVVKMLS